MCIIDKKWNDVHSIVVNTQNEYIRGRISGIVRIMAKLEKRNEYVIMCCPDSIEQCLFHVRCNRFRFNKIKKELEYLYPGMCKFD